VSEQLTSTKTGVALLETELDCAECGSVVLDFYEVHGRVEDGRGYVCCYECGEPQEVEVA
jgi:transcription elongation factor Elf1